MMTPNFIDNITNRIAKAMGMTLEEFQLHQQQHMSDLDRRLTNQMEQQKMTPEVLAKRCTL
ncbi:hypothetical protein D9M71_433050 [compost metagenome]